MLNFPVIPASQAHGAPSGGSRVLAAASILATLALSTARHHYRRWRTVRELGALDDRTLHDIGLDRSEIHSITWAGSAEQARLELRR